MQTRNIQFYLTISSFSDFVLNIVLEGPLYEHLATPQPQGTPAKLHYSQEMLVQLILKHQYCG